MPKPPKKLSPGRGFGQGIRFDWDLAIEMTISPPDRQAEMAMVAMVGDLRERIDVQIERYSVSEARGQQDGEDEAAGAVGDVVAALALMEGLLARWLLTYSPTSDAVDSALRYATETIDSFDEAAAENAAEGGEPFVAIRQMFKLPEDAPGVASRSGLVRPRGD